MEMAANPRLPIEIIFQTLRLLPPHDILDKRRTCKLFRDEIDNRYLYEVLSSVEVYGCFRPHYNIGHTDWCKQEHSARVTIKAEFAHTTNTNPDDPPSAQPDWKKPTAVFYLSPSTTKPYHADSHVRSLDPKEGWWAYVSQSAKDKSWSPAFIKWCVKISGEVYDIGILEHDGAQIEYIDHGLGSRSRTDEPGKQIEIRITGWKNMLVNCLREARFVHELMRGKASHQRFTFSREEDSRRHSRRAYLSHLKTKQAQDQENEKDKYSYLTKYADWSFALPLWAGQDMRMGKTGEHLTASAERNAMGFILGIKYDNLVQRYKDELTDLEQRNREVREGRSFWDMEITQAHWDEYDRRVAGLGRGER